MAYNSWSNQSSTSPGFPSKFAVDGLHYTGSKALVAREVLVKSVFFRDQHQSNSYDCQNYLVVTTLLVENCPGLSSKNLFNYDYMAPVVKRNKCCGYSWFE